MGSCLSSSNASEPSRAPSQPQNLAHPVPNVGFRNMKNPSQNPQDQYRKSASRLHDFQQNSLPQQKKAPLTEEERRKEESLKHKQLGNNHFKNKNYLVASQEYTKAIVIRIFPELFPSTS